MNVSHASPPKRLRLMSGIGLIEVLLAMLLISIGIVGLARFQGIFLKEGSVSKTRAIAAALAREKLEDLKSFTVLGTGAAGVFGYAEIGNNTGGAENTDGSLRIPTGNVSLANVTFGRTWTATARYYCGTNAAPSGTNCTPNKVRPDFWAARVTVTWTDLDGLSQSLALDDSIAAIDPASFGAALITGASSAPPTVPYTPGVAPNVIAIGLGSGQSKETTNPTPTLNKKGQAIINTIARYETIRFSSDSNTITREEFVTLNCSCKIANGNGLARNVAGKMVSKRYGVPADSDQAPECEVCCRDHHDDSSCNTSTSAGKNGCFDPFRPTSDYTGNDHNHYSANGQLANTADSTYAEACRLKRVDGDLRVAQDWRLIALSNIPESYFASGGTVNTSNVAAYGEYVRDYVEATIRDSTLPTAPWPVASNVAKDTSKPFASRGLYLDYLDTTSKSRFANRLATSDDTVFQEIPFYEVNLTKLAQWVSHDNGIATVRNDQLVTEQAGQSLYTRGLVTGKAIGVTEIVTSTRAGNTGVINEFITTDPDDAAAVVQHSHEVTVPGDNPIISGSITPSVPSGLVLTASNGGSCTLSVSGYSCSVPYNWTGDITPAATGYVFSPPLRSYTGIISNQTSQSFAATSSSQNFTISGIFTPNPPSVLLTATTGAVCAYVAGDGSYNCTVPENWTGSVSPSSNGYSFAPGSYSYTSLSANQANQNFTSTVVATTFTVSGSISPTVASVSFAVGAGASCSYTAATGAYTCTVPSGYSGAITPTASGVSFGPTSLNLSNVSSNLSGQNFTSTATMYTISGTVAPNASGTVFSATNGGTCSAYVNGSPNGSYSCQVPNLWSGSIVPTVSGKAFSPSARTYSNVTSDQVTENYVVTDNTTTTFTLTGSISGLSKGTPNISSPAGASCTIQARTSQCTTSCSYTCTVTITTGSTWSGTITPSSTGSGTKTFSPASRTFTDINSNQTQNFTCSGGGC